MPRHFKRYVQKQRPNSLNREVFRIKTETIINDFTFKIGEVISYATGENSFLIIKKDEHIEWKFSNEPFIFKGKDASIKCANYFNELKNKNK